MTNFKGKTVIVTGAGSGIGAAVVQRFYADDANVVLVGRTREKLERQAAGLSEVRTLVCDGDVSVTDDVNGLIDCTVEKFGGIDVLVNNAGIAEMGSAEEVALEDFDQVMKVNTRGVFLMSRAAMPYLRKAGGSIVNVSSVSGTGGDWGAAAYNMSKGAVTNLTRAMALDHGGEGVRVNAVAPSMTDTDMASGIKDDPEKFEAFKTRIPMGRPADPSEIASAIAFLAGEDAAFVNGAILPVDGGLSAANGQPALS